MNALETAIYLVLQDATLLALATGGVFVGMAPEGTTEPYVTISAQDPDRPTKVMGGTDAYREHLYLVKGVVKVAKTTSKPAACGLIDARIDTLLDNATLSVSGHTNMATLRESSVQYPEVTPDAVYWHQGGVFRVFTG